MPAAEHGVMQTPTLTPWSPPSPVRQHRPGVVALRAVALGAVVAAIVFAGVAAPFFIFGAESCGASGDVLCGLGAALLGIVVGFAAATTAYVAAGTLYIRSKLPEGRRAGAIAMQLLAPVALVAAMVVIAAVVEHLGVS